MRRTAILVAIFLAAACQQEGATAAAGKQGGAGVSVAEASAGAARAIAAPEPGVARKVSIDNDRFAFEYAYPAAAAALPTLRARLDAELDRHRSEFEAFAREEQANAKSGGYDYRKVDLAIDWAVVTELPGWLSLSATVESYEGGAHPNHNYTAILWDKAADRERKVVDLFTSRQAFLDAVQGDFCRAIDRQREERRGEKINRASGDPFDECIDPLESTVILGSSNRKAFNRIGVLVAPYAAGPYVEGDYEVTLPVTARVLAAVKPDYRAAFAVMR